MTESTEDDVPKRKVPPPPRPPPPDPVRISIASCQDSPFAPPLTPGLESDSDSDVGEVETPKVSIITAVNHCTFKRVSIRYTSDPSCSKVRQQYPLYKSLLTG